MSDSTVQSIRLRPGALPGHHSLVIVLEGMGRLEAAEYNYRQAWLIGPELRDVEEQMQGLERTLYPNEKERVS